jgi:hypothetical protein
MSRSANRLGPGDLLALLGALVLFADLFQPWYEFKLPAGALDDLGTGGGPFADLIREGLRTLAQVGAVPITGWEAFHGLDVALAGLAVAVALLVVMRVTGREDPLGMRAPGATVAAGVAVMLLVAWRIGDRPAPSQVLHLRMGIWVALGAGALIALGGWLAPRSQGASDAAFPSWGTLPPPAPASAPAGSVPPPPGSERL